PRRILGICTHVETTSCSTSPLQHTLHSMQRPPQTRLQIFFFFLPSGAHRALHSFPTRRSSDLQTGAERMPHDLSHLGFLAEPLLDRKSGSAGMPRPISYAVVCLKKKRKHSLDRARTAARRRFTGRGRLHLPRPSVSAGR